MGTQYRSGIYTTGAEQQAAAEAAIERLNDRLGVRGPCGRSLLELVQHMGMRGDGCSPRGFALP